MACRRSRVRAPLAPLLRGTRSFSGPIRFAIVSATGSIASLQAKRYSSHAAESRASISLRRSARLRRSSRSRPDRQPVLPPGLKPADHVGGVATKPAEGGRREAGGVARIAEEDDREVIPRELRIPMLARRIEPPLEYVARDYVGARDLTVPRALLDRPDVHERGALLLRGLRLRGAQPGELLARLLPQLV